MTWNLHCDKDSRSNFCYERAKGFESLKLGASKKVLLRTIRIVLEPNIFRSLIRGFKKSLNLGYFWGLFQSFKIVWESYLLRRSTSVFRGLKIDQTQKNSVEISFWEVIQKLFHAEMSFLIKKNSIIRIKDQVLLK